MEQKADHEVAAVKESAMRFWQQAEKAHWHPVSGVSMWPFLKHGDSVLIQPIPKIHSTKKLSTNKKLSTKSVCVGDVVLIKFGDRLLVHRIARVNPDQSIIAWGDFNLTPDPLAAPEQIIGIAQSIKRKNRQISLGPKRKFWGLTVVYGRPMLKPFLRIGRKLLRLKAVVLTNINTSNR